MGYAENKIKRDWALMQFENGLGFGDGSDQMGLGHGLLYKGCEVPFLSFPHLISLSSLLWRAKALFSLLSLPFFSGGR